MSMFNYYKNIKYIDHLDYSFEDISIESPDWVNKTIKAIKIFFNKVKEFITKIAKTIWKGLIKLYESIFKNRDKDKKLLDVITNEDLIEIYKKVLAGYNGRTIWLIRKDKTIIDLVDFNKKFDEAIEEMNRWSRTALPDAVREIKSIRDSGTVILKREMLDGVDFTLLSKLIDQNNISTIYQNLKYNLPKQLSKVQNELIRIDHEIKEFDLSFSGNPEDRNKLGEAEFKLKQIYEVISTKFKIYQSIIGFYRMVSYELNQFTFDEPCPKDLTLYHLSFDDKLPYILEPRIPNSNKNAKIRDAYEILPKRISFAPTVEGCYYGVAPATISDNIKRDGNVYYVEGLIYKALLYSDSRKIKDIYMAECVTDYRLTKEVALTTDTHIELVGKIRYNIDKSKKINYVNSSGVKQESNPMVLNYQYE